jgi:phage shock protein E
LGVIKILLFLVLGAAALWWLTQTTGPDPQLDHKALISAKATIVDVRSASEVAQGSFPNAIHIPHDEAGKRLSEFGPKDKPVIVFCASGNRSGKVKALLEKEGWTQVHNGGGLRDMLKATQEK